MLWVNEITSPTAFPGLQGKSAVSLLGWYCSLPDCTPHNACGAYSLAGLRWQNDFNAVACRGLCSGFPDILQAGFWWWALGLRVCAVGCWMSEPEVKRMSVGSWWEAFGGEASG